jgi:membrane-bound metal-dependent hydrolase YbcI (DUF457 family)
MAERQCVNTEAHLAVGWALAQFGGGRSSRAIRAAVTIAAIAPDADALAWVFGPEIYAESHHSLGHNVFFSLLVSATAVWLCRPHSWWRILLLTQAAFYLHYFGDYYFTRFPLVYFWPLSEREFLGPWRFGLDHPVNTLLSYLSLAMLAGSAAVLGRTPIELVWPTLDQRLANLVRPRPLRCHVCGGSANEVCCQCGMPACLSHGRLTRQMRVRCSAC